MSSINYSKFDHIGDSDDEEEEPVTPPQARTQPPPNVMEDLEDYFRRMDERRTEAEAAGMSGGQAPTSVDRLDESQLASLKATTFIPGSSYTECSVCLADFEAGESLVELPCAARHLFHANCAHAALSRSVYCPLCRVDVRPALIASTPTAAPVAPLSPRQLGFTRDGGVIMRSAPRPFHTMCPAPLANPQHLLFMQVRAQPRGGRAAPGVHSARAALAGWVRRDHVPGGRGRARVARAKVIHTYVSHRGAVLCECVEVRCRSIKRQACVLRVVCVPYFKAVR